MIHGTRRAFIGDPTPQLTRTIREDMEASALDAFLTLGDCSATLLRERYGFQPHQVEAHGHLAIFNARHAWLERKAAGDAA